MQSIRTIKLINGGQTIVEQRDYKRVAKERWFQSSNGYAIRQGWEGGKHWQIFLHRVINKTPPGKFTDHINGNKLDNRRSNLRTVNKAQNSTNRPKIDRRVLTCKFKGVSWHESTNLWRARIRDGNFERTTYHKTEHQAALDYNRMALEHFKEYARLNELPFDVEPTVPRKKTSQYRGVAFKPKSERWEAGIDIDGLWTHIGSFGTEQEAALAYNAAAIKLRGDKAKLNVVK